MPYDESLATRIRDLLRDTQRIEEKRMFGGVGFLWQGNMLVGVWKDALIVRLGLDGYNEALREPFVRAFDVTGKPMRGWVMVALEGVEHDATLREWIERSMHFVQTLPPK